jgi:hypothetical protein
MKIIKLFVIHMLLLSSFQTFLVGSKPNNRHSVVFRHRNISRGNTKSLYGYSDDFISCLDDNFSTPEGIAKVINLQADKSSSLLEFAIVPGPDSPDSEKFTLKGR